VESHEATIEINESTELSDFILNLKLKVLEMKYLASIDGGKAIYVKYNDEPLAVIAQEMERSKEAKYIVNQNNKILILV
jgi:hypothetical protein